MALKLRYWTITLLLFCSLALTFERPAHAYTDPGSALFLFQSVGAVASGILFYFRRRIRKLFSRSQPETEAASAAAVISRVDS